MRQRKQPPDSVTARQEIPEDQALSIGRPRTLDECVGQTELIESLRISIAAAKQRAEPLEHVLLHGPPGLGKTTIARVIANEMGAEVRVSSGPALERAGDLVGILTNLQPRDVFFIDEVHRLPHVVEEYLYPAMEEFEVDFVLDSGPHARTVRLPLKPFTLVGATTRAGLLTPALRERFGIFHYLRFYSPEELREIVVRYAVVLRTDVEPAAAEEIARRSRGTARIAKRLLRRARDYAQVKAGGKVTAKIADEALTAEGVDKAGLARLDRLFLSAIIEHYGGGPVGIETIAATLNEEAVTLEDVVEPYLLQAGFLARTAAGRKVLPAAYEHLGMAGEAEARLFGTE
jgi:Holliday junction DNA helicase RuvB